MPRTAKQRNPYGGPMGASFRCLSNNASPASTPTGRRARPVAATPGAGQSRRAAAREMMIKWKPSAGV
jgi:hypothetical protein